MILGVNSYRSRTLLQFLHLFRWRYFSIVYASFFWCRLSALQDSPREETVRNLIHSSFLPQFVNQSTLRLVGNSFFFSSTYELYSKLKRKGLNVICVYITMMDKAIGKLVGYMFFIPTTCFYGLIRRQNIWYFSAIPKEDVVQIKYSDHSSPRELLDFVSLLNPV